MIKSVPENDWLLVIQGLNLNSASDQKPTTVQCNAWDPERI